MLAGGFSALRCLGTLLWNKETYEKKRQGKTVHELMHWKYEVLFKKLIDQLEEKYEELAEIDWEVAGGKKMKQAFLKL